MKLEMPEVIQYKENKYLDFTKQMYVKNVEIISREISRPKRNWERIINKTKKITNGSFKDCLLLNENYYIEHLDNKHQYGPEQTEKYVHRWKNSQDNDYFNWLGNNRKEDTSSGTYVAYLKNTLFLKNTMADIKKGVLYPKHSFPKRWDERIRSNNISRLIFVVDKNYNLYVAFKENTKLGKIQHASFLNGSPVRMAGCIEADSDFNIKYISDDSGHYRHRVKSMVGFVKYLEKNKSIDLNELYVQSFGQPVLTASQLLKEFNKS